jgi:hypothetical protein
MHYVVDASNRVVDVDDEWDTAAAGANGGARALRAQIVGQPLESFLAGDATKMFVRAALDAARLLRQTQVLPYRCDSPTQRRRFEMVISPLPDGAVHVAHRLVLAETRPPRAEQPKAQVHALAGWRCSQCMAVRLTGSHDWVEAEGYAPLAQDVCPSCATKLFHPIQPSER